MTTYEMIKLPQGTPIELDVSDLSHYWGGLELVKGTLVFDASNSLGNFVFGIKYKAPKNLRFPQWTLKKGEVCETFDYAAWRFTRL